MYRTYAGDREYHRIRFFLIIALSSVVSMFGVNLAQTAFATMSSAISILAGFTFTALFSSHYLTVSDLPLASNEDDRRDLTRLRSLSNNFRVRSKFFIILSVINLLLILILSVNIDLSHLFGFALRRFYEILFSYVPALPNAFNVAFAISKVIMTFIVFCLFLECLYTFYRLAETIMAALDIRREYLDSHAEQ